MLDDGHLGESAELYALGTLGDIERARVERHVRTCDGCAKRLGDAETTVLGLIEADASQPAMPRGRTPAFTSRAPWWIGAVAAAAFVAGLLPWGFASLRERPASRVAQDGQQVALTAMLAGHFAHAAFVSGAPGAPAAKVIYAREGGWLYVIVAPGSETLDVRVARNGKRAIVGSIAGSGATRSAFVSGIGRVDVVELLDRGVLVAYARVVYATR
jgi:hypothetical protein